MSIHSSNVYEIELKILDVYETSKWDDTAISEISFFNKGVRIGLNNTGDRIIYQLNTLGRIEPEEFREDFMIRGFSSMQKKIDSGIFDIDEYRNRSDNPLFFAVNTNDVEMVWFLLANGLRHIESPVPPAYGGGGFSCLEYLISENKFDLLKMYFSYFNSESSSGKEILYAHTPEMIAYLLDNGYELKINEIWVNEYDYSDEFTNFLCEAVRKENTELVRYLINCGYNVNFLHWDFSWYSPVSTVSTPLEMAVITENRIIIDILKKMAPNLFLNLAE